MDLDDGYEGDVTPTSQGKPDIAELKRRARFNVMRDLVGRPNSVFDFEFDVKTNPKRSAPFPSPVPSGDPYSSHWSSSQSSPIETPDQSFPSTPVTLPLHDLDVHATKHWTAADWAHLPIHRISHPQSIRKSRQSQQEAPGVVSPENTIVVDKPYKCKNFGCDKAYKNMNGLKYHRMHGVCNKNNLSHTDLGNDSPAPSTPPPSSAMSTPAPSVPASPAMSMHAGFSNPVAEEKKYSCEKCSKRYKNLNGLKYHKKATHKTAEDVAAAPFSLATGMTFTKNLH
jgi:hypothetical protein